MVVLVPVLPVPTGTAPEQDTAPHIATPPKASKLCQPGIS